MRDDLPSGTVTFLFTDVEGSTRLLRELGVESYAEALAEHRSTVREHCAARDGVEVDTQGDAFFFAFPEAPGAVAAAQAITDALAPGPIQLRIGLHTGTPLVTDEGYVGDDVHFAARVAASGHGGQVLLSESSRVLVEGDFTDLGEHRLKDIEGAVSIHQLGDLHFAPLRTISNTNLPRPASSFVGRQAELAEVLSLLEGGSRLVTLTGPGGSGKTRLALEAASTLVPSYKAGVFWVGLASLRDASLVSATVSQAIGSTDGLAAYIAEREMLLLLDNLEQVIEAAPEVAALLLACPNLKLLVTSRELLRVHGEVEFDVPPLASEEAVSLFCERSRLEPSDEIAELCARLDELPLALELAAARTKSLSPRQILDRLAERLDLLRGGRDADPRQQTLRAAIEWSYGLLSGEEQRLFRALSVFRGGCMLEAAEAVADADVDTLQSLVEKSLVRFSIERYWLLETVREYAHEQLAREDELSGIVERHARFYLARLERDHPERMGSRLSEILAWYRRDADNVRAMLDRLTEVAPVDAARAAYLHHRYWVAHGAYTEERERVQTLLACSNLPDHSRADLLVSLSETEFRLGNAAAGEEALEQALVLAEVGSASRVVALQIAAWVAITHREVHEGLRLSRQAVLEAESADDVTRVSALGDLGQILTRVGRADEARLVVRSAVEEARRNDFLMFVITGEAELGLLDLAEGDYVSARRVLMSGLEQTRRLGLDHYPYELEVLRGIGFAQLGLGARREARASFLELLEAVLAANHGMHPDLVVAISAMALAADPADFRAGARLLGAVAKLRLDAGIETSMWEGARLELERRFEQPLIRALGEKAYAAEQASGARMSLEETIGLARSLADA